MWGRIKNYLYSLIQAKNDSEEADVEMSRKPPAVVNRDIIIRDDDTPSPPSTSLKKRKKAPSDSTEQIEQKKQAKQLKQAQDRAHKEICARDAHTVNEFTNLAQAYGGLVSLSSALNTTTTAGSVNFGWIFFLGGLVKGFGSLVNIIRGDRSIASPLGLIEAPIEMVLGAAMTAISSILLTMNPNDSAYMKLQITNGILAGMISGLLTVEQGYHRIRIIFDQKSNIPRSIQNTTQAVSKDKKAQERKEKEEQKIVYANSSHTVNQYTNLAQGYAGLFSMATAISMNSPTAGTENYGWVLFLGGLIKGFGSTVNIIRGDRSIAGPLGLIEAPVEMVLGATMLATSSVLLTMSPDDSSYTAFQITNGILAGMASGLLTLEQGYHRIRAATPESENTSALTMK